MRVPLEPCLAAGGASKRESKVITMQYGSILMSLETKVKR